MPSDTFDGNRFSCCGQIWWKSAIEKLTSRLVLLTKKPAARDTTESPMLPALSRWRQKFRERCRPLTCACLPNLVWTDGWGLPELSRVIPERLIFRYLSDCNIRWGFQHRLQCTIIHILASEQQHNTHRNFIPWVADHFISRVNFKVASCVRCLPRRGVTAGWLQILLMDVRRLRSNVDRWCHDADR